MGRKGVKVECGHCSFVARTDIAMEEHMKQHDMITTIAYTDDTAYGPVDALCSTQQEGLAAACQAVDSVDTSLREHHNEVLHGETQPTQYMAFQPFKDTVLCESSETQLRRTQDTLDDEQGRISWLQHTADDVRGIDELSQNNDDSNQICQLKITEVRSIRNEADTYKGYDREDHCSADAPMVIMPVRSIKQESVFHCKIEPPDDQDTRQQTDFIQFGDVGARSDDVCAKIEPVVAIKQEPRDSSPQRWGEYQPTSSSMSRDRTRDISSAISGEEAHEGVLSLAGRRGTCADIASSEGKKDAAEVVGFADSDTESAPDCDRTLAEAVEQLRCRMERRRRSAERATSSPEPLLEVADRAVPLSAVAPNLFAALTESIADGIMASDSETDEPKTLEHQDHTYAHLGEPGSLTCARVRSYQDNVLLARAKRRLRRRRAPTMTAWPPEFYSLPERQATPNKRNQPDNVCVKPEALSPTKQSNIRDTSVTPDAPVGSPGREVKPRRSPTAKPAAKALPAPELSAPALPPTALHATALPPTALHATGGTSQYVCAICGDSFRVRASFCSHVINCHKEVGGRLYYCAYCKYLAMDIALVRSHMDGVHGDHETRVVAAGLDHDDRVQKDHKRTVPLTDHKRTVPLKDHKRTVPLKDHKRTVSLLNHKRTAPVMPTVVPVRVSDRVLRRNKTARLKAHVHPGAFVEAVVTRKRKKSTKKRRKRCRDSSDDDEFGYAEEVYPLDALCDRAIKSETPRSNNTARKSQSTGRMRYESPEALSSVGVQTPPSMTYSSPDCWQEYPDDDDLDECVPELVDDTCCELFENSFLSLGWDEQETLGRTLCDVPDRNVDDVSDKVVIKQEPSNDTYGDNSNSEQTSRRYSRRTRKPKRPHCMCGSCDEEYMFSPTTRPCEIFSDVDHAKAPAAADGDLWLSKTDDKVVGLTRVEDPKLKMTPTVLLCDIVVAILAGGGGCIL